MRKIVQKSVYGINFGAIYEKMFALTRKFVNRKKVKVTERSNVKIVKL